MVLLIKRCSLPR